MTVSTRKRDILSLGYVFSSLSMSQREELFVEESRVADDSSAGRMLIESSMRFLEHGMKIDRRNIHPSLQGNT
jgi:hypothetical protein